MNAIRTAFLATLVLLSTLAGAAPSRDAPIDARLASCDAAVVGRAADEVLRDPATLREPLILFQAAMGLRMAGRKEDAAFFYLAARLRTSRQILFEKGDRPQLLGIMNMTVGGVVTPVLQDDPDLAREAVRRAIEWDRKTPDPFRDGAAARTLDYPKQLAEIDAGLARLPGQLRDEPPRSANERAAVERFIETGHAERCGPGALDAGDLPAANKRITTEAENLVKSHPLAIERAGGAIASVDVRTAMMGPSRLPTRVSLVVTPAAGKQFYAEVDVAPTISANRKLGAVKFSLACVTDPSSKRDAHWKNVCLDDPTAIRPR